MLILLPAGCCCITVQNELDTGAGLLINSHDGAMRLSKSLDETLQNLDIMMQCEAKTTFDTALTAAKGGISNAQGELSRQSSILLLIHDGTN